jgi:hypothetical protein
MASTTTTMMTIQSHVGIVILSLGACRFYGEARSATVVWLCRVSSEPNVTMKSDRRSLCFTVSGKSDRRSLCFTVSGKFREGKERRAVSRMSGERLERRDLAGGVLHEYATAA